jgi:hypothetical protein
MRIILHKDYPAGYVVGVGPAVPQPCRCSACQSMAVAQCQWCHGCFCVTHWWRHSHREEMRAGKVFGAA